MPHVRAAADRHSADQRSIGAHRWSHSSKCTGHTDTHGSAPESAHEDRASLGTRRVSRTNHEQFGAPNSMRYRSNSIECQFTNLLPNSRSAHASAQIGGGVDVRQRRAARASRPAGCRRCRPARACCAPPQSTSSATRVVQGGAVDAGQIVVAAVPRQHHVGAEPDRGTGELVDQLGGQLAACRRRRRRRARDRPRRPPAARGRSPAADRRRAPRRAGSRRAASGSA